LRKRRAKGKPYVNNTGLGGAKKTGRRGLETDVGFPVISPATEKGCFYAEGKGVVGGGEVRRDAPMGSNQNYGKLSRGNRKGITKKNTERERNRLAKMGVEGNKHFGKRGPAVPGKSLQKCRYQGDGPGGIQGKKKQRGQSGGCKEAEVDLDEKTDQTHSEGKNEHGDPS